MYTERSQFTIRYMNININEIKEKEICDFISVAYIMFRNGACAPLGMYNWILM